ncbi:EamA family transporter RarD [Candidatus Liberibacter sp.]|uniref:EamA family transporter RarD n=1 Tax=Candidatus Liberibacter sp. TaxID=34022 RepID=UPI0015F72E4E|nr:EamA family transporter RarD [Candidatus Liberibacter sp.]MBA5724017.1 EamA family transporter RarD [Candidatus Liberibacter sp.]
MIKQNSLNSGISKQSKAIGGSHGVIISFLTYICWGFVPLYMRFMSEINVIEIIAHRVLWSLPAIALAVAFFEGLHAVKSICKNPQVLLKIMINAMILAAHWGLYIYSVVSGNLLKASLAFFISPLLSISLGTILLKEPLKRSQIIPIGLIVVAIGIMSTGVGGLPWLSLAIAGTWSIYAFFRKTIPADPNSGFLLEMIALSIPATVIAFGFTKIVGESSYFVKDTHYAMLLIGYGLINGILFCTFSYALKITRLSYIGIMEYIAPTIMLINTIFLLKQSVSPIEIVAFSIVMCASVIYAIPAYLDACNKE